MKAGLFLFILLGEITAQASFELTQRIARIESKYKVNIIVDQVFHAQARPARSSKFLPRYLELLEEEISYYPPDFFKNTGIDKLVLVTGLSVTNQRRAAMPAPRAVFYSIDSTGSYDGPYLRSVFHHELYHSIEYGYFKTYYYKWPQWSDLNAPGFQYGQGGSFAYSNRQKYQGMKQQPGFLNAYSQLGEEEDRSEFFEALMNVSARDEFLKRCKADKVIRQKAEILAHFISHLSKIKGPATTWQKSASLCQNAAR